MVNETNEMTEETKMVTKTITEGKFAEAQKELKSTSGDDGRENDEEVREEKHGTKPPLPDEQGKPKPSSETVQGQFLTFLSSYDTPFDTAQVTTREKTRVIKEMIRDGDGDWALLLRAENSKDPAKLCLFHTLFVGADGCIYAF